LPEDAEDPVVLKFDIGALSVMDLAVSGDRPLDEIYEITDDVIKPELMKIQGLASINIIGGKEREIQIRLRREMMRSQDVDIMDVVMCLAAENLNIPSGHIAENRKEYNIRVSGEFTSVGDISNIIMSTNGGRNVRLRDVAYVVDDFREQRKLTRYEGAPSVGVSLLKRSDANVVKVVDEVRNNLDRIKALLPEDMEIHVASDNSTFIRQSIAEVVNNMGIGIILTGLILFLFLHTWQATIIAATAMPASIIATFILIRFAGFTLNFMTLLGLAVTVGVLVTNSIVVLENIIRYTRKEKDIKDASIKGTTEIAAAVGASTLTNIVVFTPIAFMGGIVGQFFYAFGLTVAFATIFSLVVSFTLTPMLASKLFEEKKTKGYGFDLFALGVLTFILSVIALAAAAFTGNMLAQSLGAAGMIVSILIGLGVSGIIGRALFRYPLPQLKRMAVYRIWRYMLKALIYLAGLVVSFILFRYLFGAVTGIVVNGVFIAIILLNIRFAILSKFGRLWDKYYDKLALDYRNTLDRALDRQGLVVFSVITIFAVSLFLVRYVGSEFTPKADMGYVQIVIEMPPGTNMNQTDNTLSRVEHILETIPEIESYYAVLGEAPGTFIGKNIGIQYSEITIKLVPRSERTISSRDMIEILKRRFTGIPTADITMRERSAMGGEAAALQIEITGDDLDALNRTAEQVMAVADGVPGTVDVRSSSREGVPEIQILPDRTKMADYGVSLATLAGVLRANIDGNVATKYRVGNKEYDIRVQLDKSYIQFADQVRNITVKKNDQYIPITELAAVTESEGPTSVLRKNKQRLVIVSMDIVNRSLGDIVNDIKAQTDLLDLQSGTAINFGGQAEIQQESFGELLKALVLAIVLAFIVLAAIMESYIHPFIIMMTLPLALIGVILSLVITGKSLSIISLMAVVMLVGIVVNNGILLIDYMQKLRKGGMNLREAILEAASVRLRPIIMTNMATVFSMIPLALELGEGSEIRSPMAIVSIGALITSTIFTLFIIPLLYNVIETLREKSAA